MYVVPGFFMCMLLLLVNHSQIHTHTYIHTQQCLDKAALDWTSSPNGAILLNGEPFHIKGKSGVNVCVYVLNEE
jgi:hypothetical protein